VRDRARAVIIGGGITGCSVAYHLARAGWSDLILLDKGPLTSGSTCHAAGLVTQFNPSPTMMRFRRYSIELYRELGVFETVGSVRIASSPESLAELQRGVSRARAIGLEVELASPAETLRLLPQASPESLYGSVYMPGDGNLDPHSATYALAGAARDLGAEIRTGERVTGIELGPSHEVRAVVTESGRVETEVVINAAGMWAPQVAALVGAQLVSTPVEHQHIALAAVPGHELPRDLPCFRDPDYLVYGKSEAGGALFGGYEHDPASRWVDGVPWDHSGQTVPADEARFAPLMQGAAKRFPFLADAGVVKLVCHPDAMTPDGNPLVGELPGVPGFFVAAGLSLNGFGGAGGIGKAVAELVTSGESELDLQSYRPWRFGAVHRDPVYASENAREAYRYYYRLRYPLDSDVLGRPRRTSALHERMQDAGAVFATKNGWERPDYCEPGQPWRRAGEEQRAFGWAEPPYSGVLAEESAALRERVGMIDMTSFGKIAVSGPGAAALLERVCDAHVDRGPGSVVYTQFLNERGGIVADVTVTRLAEQRFRVVTGAAAVDSDLGWLRLHARAGDDPVELHDETDALCVIGMWGPHARDVLQAVTEDDVSAAAFAFGRGRTLRLDGAELWAQRITYVGELGYELYVEPKWGVQVWDRLSAAGTRCGIRPVGYRVLDSLRMEKGYRAFGSDLTAGDTPDEAGLGFCVALERKAEFVGRAAVEAQRERGIERRLRTLLVGDGVYECVYGGEAVIAGGSVVGRVRSAAYGYTVGQMIANAYLPRELAPDTPLAVEVLGAHVPAELAADTLYDGGNLRIRA
jgi:glycine cleavage system aminomethyltransferase T/glycine/D-amino acid oxidase-like deaminating enzyme